MYFKILIKKKLKIKNEVPAKLFKNQNLNQILEKLRLYFLLGKYSSTARHRRRITKTLEQIAKFYSRVSIMNSIDTTERNRRDKRLSLGTKEAIYTFNEILLGCFDPSPNSLNPEPH